MLQFLNLCIYLLSITQCSSMSTLFVYSVLLKCQVAYVFSGCIRKQRRFPFVLSRPLSCGDNQRLSSRDTCRRVASGVKSRRCLKAKSEEERATWRSKTTCTQQTVILQYSARRRKNLATSEHTNFSDGRQIFNSAPIFLTWAKLGWGSRDPPQWAQKVQSVVGGRFCRNVAERETRVLSTGGQQGDMGSPGAVPEPVPGGLRRLRIRVVTHFFFPSSSVCAL